MGGCCFCGNSTRHSVFTEFHAPDGTRILGYDNAHAIKLKGMKYAGQRMSFDHMYRHASDKGVPYVFVDAYQLLSDFFIEVDLVLKEVKSK